MVIFEFYSVLLFKLVPAVSPAVSVNFSPSALIVNMICPAYYVPYGAKVLFSAEHFIFSDCVVKMLRRDRTHLLIRTMIVCFYCLAGKVQRALSIWDYRVWTHWFLWKVGRPNICMNAT